MLSVWPVALILTVLGGGVRGQEDEGASKTLSGVLRHDPKLEGGVWTLKVEGTVYDLHGDLSACSSGDTVEVQGRAYPDRVCYHMVGVVFKVTKVTVTRTPEKRAPGPPGSAPR
jgi:hypothetical protein